jgi:hypothetical protein
MGKCSEGIAASEGSDGLGSREAHDVSVGPQEDRGCSKSEMGDDTGG